MSTASATTYHSFQDVDLQEPGQVGPHYQAEDTFAPMDDRANHVPKFGINGRSEERKLQRQDSGYESIPSASRSNTKRSYKEPRVSTTSLHSAQTRKGSRPSMRRAAKSHPSSRNGQQQVTAAATASSVYVYHPQPHGDSFYHFPSLDAFPGSHCEDEDDSEARERSYPPPPQTTHYWTSDHTRRLEYAAIDAASRGVKGWFLKHVVPDCFVPKENRRIGFDDDTGSVRRYRLDLDCDEVDEKGADDVDSSKDDDRSVKQGTGGKKMGWLFGR